MAQAPWSAPAASAAHVRCAFSRVRGDGQPGAVGGAGALARALPAVPSPGGVGGGPLSLSLPIGAPGPLMGLHPHQLITC